MPASDEIINVDHFTERAHDNLALLYGGGQRSDIAGTQSRAANGLVAIVPDTKRPAAETR